MGIWVGRYAMVAGEVREHGPWMVDQRRDREDGPIRLIVLAEPIDQRSAEFCGEVAEAVAALFGRETLSVTGGLLRALRQAHANLAEWNERSLREHQVAVGLTCVAIRDGETTVAQIGPGLAYVAAADGSTRRLATEGYPGAAPLGGREPIEPLFSSVNLDREHLLLISSTVEQELGEAAIAEVLAAGPERALAELFTRTRSIPELAAALIADLALADETPPAPPSAIVDEPAPPPPLTVESAPAAASERVRAEQAATSIGWPERRAAPRMPAVRQPSRRGGAARPPPRRPGTGSDTATRGLWIGGSIAAFVLVVVLGWFVLPGLFEGDSASRLDDALAAAGIRVSEARSATDPAAQRQALQAALGELERARGIDPEHAQLLALQDEVLAMLAELDAIVELGPLDPVLRFAGTLTAPLTTAGIVFGGGSIWLVDDEQGRVFRVDPEGDFDPVELYRSGTASGELVTAAPLALTWDQANERLLILDEERQLWSLRPSDPPFSSFALPLRDAVELRSIAAVASYVGNLYLLDPDAGEVWRYLPAGDGFDSERAGLLGSIELPEATLLAVDGDVYVQDGGTLRRFRQGTEQPSLLVGIDTPPLDPVALVEDVIRGWLYVADPGNQRIVVGDREGLFLRQYRHTAFGDLRGIALAADGETLYVLTADGIDAFAVTITTAAE